MALIENKKIRLNYEILEEFEAGMELRGHEVKALRARRGDISAAHVTVRGGEAYLLNMTIPAYQPANTPKGYDPERMRRLLLGKDEIAKLAGFEGKKGLTIVPISVYDKGAKLKAKIAVVRGKKKYDKREAIKKKDTERELARSLKRNIRL